MKLTKWLLLFFFSAVFVVCLFALFHMAVDPFGIFGDKLFDRYDYNMTNNPRIAKIGYLDAHHSEYDSYIIGCSKTSSIPVLTLNRYLPGASFYNLMMYGGDLYDIELTANYVIEHYAPKNIIINIGLEEAAAFGAEGDRTKENLHYRVDGSSGLLFTLKYLLLNPRYSIDKLRFVGEYRYLPTEQNVFVPRTGEYNKLARDTAHIPPLGEYVEQNPDFSKPIAISPLNDMDACAAAVGRIRHLCEEKGIRFILIASPVYERELQCYDPEQLCLYREKLAEATDFYDFSGYSPISLDPRYFYDSMHFRNAVGEMMLAFLFGDDSVYRPENFGHLTTKDNVREYNARVIQSRALCLAPEEYSLQLPVLMYHHFTEGPTDNFTAVSAANFEAQLIALSENGYHSVTIDEVIAYVYAGTPLPENPVLITIDDGYRSNLQIAYPLLKRYGMRAFVSVIGVSVGKSTYKDTGASIEPHFALEEAREAFEDGTLGFISHTYDMHNVPGLDLDYREGILKKRDETLEEYIKAFREDFRRSREQLTGAFGTVPAAYTYPYGKYYALAEAMLHEMGIRVTFTTDYGMSRVIQGLPQSLLGLKRINIDDQVDGETLLLMIRNLQD